jgi:hypothetical protein
MVEQNLNNSFPRMFVVRQKFDKWPPPDIRATVQRELVKIHGRLKPGARIAVAVGSRGISNLHIVVGAVLDVLKTAGTQPFIVPAMGSHGGATPEGQTELLAEYGVSEKHLNVPVRAAMEVEKIGVTDDGVDVYFSTEALRADGIVVVNRVKPHTDFASDTLGSGILKMIVVGLGKRVGAANYHAAVSHLGHERVIPSVARVTLRVAPILCGVAIVEDQFHNTAKITVLPAEKIEAGEAALFPEAKRLLPKLPFDQIDLLIIDRIGKNISGAGMDPNVTGRRVHGYSSFLGEKTSSGPTIGRIFVRDLTPETHGNGIGIGFADFTTSRLVRALDLRVTAINALTSLTPHSAKVPIHFETDREAVATALTSLALKDVSQAKVVRIADTLSLAKLEVSESYSEAMQNRDDLERIGHPAEMRFDASENLVPLA